MVRAERMGDAADICEVTQAAFKDDQHGDHNEYLIVDALRRRKALAVSLVAERDGKIVGHVAVSPVTISDGSDHWYGLGPISVLPEYQRQGVGSELVRAALSELKALSAKGCVLLGEPNYYQRFGFKTEPALVFSDAPAEYFQAISFSSNLPAGEVTYHSAFYIE